MAQTDLESKPLFALSADMHISASVAEVYALVSDLDRSGEWSPECLGGDWVSGKPGTVGAVFRGANRRSEDVVSWAPVVRGDWITEAEVVTAEPGVTFRWAIRDSLGEKQESVWGFDIEPAGQGVVLTHHFWMGKPTEGIRGITSKMDGEERERFFKEWGAKVAADLDTTLRRIKKIIEK
ncbi:MAG TPA: SRPBCC family protein [Micromonosporaceae bacterium]|nr:SRPBCC family protein [Micromonosporaceae bacterium]